MKKIFLALLGLMMIGLFAPAGPIPTVAQMAQPDEQQGQPGRDLNQQQPDPGMESEKPGMESEEGPAPGGTPMTPTRGTVSGEVLDIDPATGLIAVRTPEGMVNIFTVEEGARGRLDQIEEGDQIDLVVVLNAVEVTPQEEGGPMEPPAG